MSNRNVKEHRDAIDIPQDGAERKKLVGWVMDHPLWTYSTTYINSLQEEVAYSDGSFHECVQIEPTYVNPETGCIDDDETKNTRLDIWIEAGGYTDIRDDDSWSEETRRVKPFISGVDHDLDCGGVTMEEALLNLAQRVHWYYGEGCERRQGLPEKCGGFIFDSFFFREKNSFVNMCVYDDQGYCTQCGYGQTSVSPDDPGWDAEEIRAGVKAFCEDTGAGLNDRQRNWALEKRAKMLEELHKFEQWYRNIYLPHVERYGK